MGNSLKLPSPTKLAQLGHFPPASQAGRLAGPVFLCTVYVFSLGYRWDWQWNFVPKKFCGVDSEQLPFFCGRKCSLRGIPKFTEKFIPKHGTEGNSMTKTSFTKNPAPANRIDSTFSSETCFGTEFRVVVSSAE
jgi:hypothetical protein